MKNEPVSIKAAHAPARQVLFCDYCQVEPCTADDWCAPAAALICPLCLERLMDAQTLEPKL